MDKCDVDENGQIIDPISLDVIDEKDLISFQQNGKIFCFDINTLYEWNKNRIFKQNPLTRQQLDEHTSYLLSQYSSSNDDNIENYHNHIHNQDYNQYHNQDYNQDYISINSDSDSDSDSEINDIYEYNENIYDDNLHNNILSYNQYIYNNLTNNIPLEDLSINRLINIAERMNIPIRYFDTREKLIEKIYNNRLNDNI